MNLLNFLCNSAGRVVSRQISAFLHKNHLQVFDFSIFHGFLGKFRSARGDHRRRIRPFLRHAAVILRSMITGLKTDYGIYKPAAHPTDRRRFLNSPSWHFPYDMLKYPTHQQTESTAPARYFLSFHKPIKRGKNLWAASSDFVQARNV